MRLPLASLFIAAIVCASAAQQAEHSPEETRILALENAWNQAEAHKDLRSLDQLLDGSLVYVDYDGSRMNKAQFMASISAPSLSADQIVNESQEARVYGDSAVVTGIYREKGTKSGKPYLRRGRFTDTWVFRNGVWVCVASQSTLISH